MAKLKTESAQNEYYLKVKAFFAEDEDIKIIYDEDENLILIYAQDNKYKGQALKNLFAINDKTDRPCKVKVVTEATTDPIDTNISDAFLNNSAFVATKSFGEIYEKPIIYIIFTNKVVQYPIDNIINYDGICSTLYEFLARDIFGNIQNVNFCTKVDDIASINLKWL